MSLSDSALRKLDLQREELRKLGYGRRIRKGEVKGLPVRQDAREKKTGKGEDSHINEAFLQEIQRLKRRNRELDDKNAKLESKLAVSQEAIWRYEKKLDKVISESEDRKDEVARLKNRDFQLSREVRELRRQVGEYVADNGALRSENRVLSRRGEDEGEVEGKRENVEREDVDEDDTQDTMELLKMGHSEMDGAEMDTQELLML